MTNEAEEKNEMLNEVVRLIGRSWGRINSQLQGFSDLETAGYLLETCPPCYQQQLKYPLQLVDDAWDRLEEASKMLLQAQSSLLCPEEQSLLQLYELEESRND